MSKEKEDDATMRTDAAPLSGGRPQRDINDDVQRGTGPSTTTKGQQMPTGSNEDHIRAPTGRREWRRTMRRRLCR